MTIERLGAWLTVARALADMLDTQQTLDDVRDTCRNLGVSATLRDATGRTRGYVNSSGDHSLA